MFPPGLDYELNPQYNVTLTVFDGEGGHNVSTDFSLQVLEEATKRPKVADLPLNISLPEGNYSMAGLLWKLSVENNSDPHLSFWLEVTPDDGKFYLSPNGSMYILGLCFNRVLFQYLILFVKRGLYIWSDVFSLLNITEHNFNQIQL